MSLLVAFACSRSPEPAGEGGAGAGTTTSGVGGTTTSSAAGGAPGGGAGSEPIACYDPDLALQLPGRDPEVGQDLCSSEQIDDFLALCIAGDVESVCQAWLEDEANAICLECLLNTEETGPIPPIAMADASDGYSYVFVMVVACEAIARDLPDCAWPLQALDFCQSTACLECDDWASSSEACLAAANADICAGLAEGVPVECAGITELTSPHCAGDGFVEFYNNVANYFCGPPQ